MKRNPWAMDQKQEALIRLQEFAEEAGGHMRLYLIRKDNKEMKAALERRDPLALTLALTITKALRELRGSERRCTGCDHVFQDDEPHAFVVWIPNCGGNEKPEHLIAQGICVTCCDTKNDRELLDDAMIFIRLIFPDTEEIEEAHEFIDDQEAH